LNERTDQSGDDDDEAVGDGDGEDDVFGDAELVQERLFTTHTVDDVELARRQTQEVADFGLDT